MNIWSQMRKKYRIKDRVSSHKIQLYLFSVDMMVKEVTPIRILIYNNTMYMFYLSFNVWFVMFYYF